MRRESTKPGAIGRLLRSRSGLASALALFVGVIALAVWAVPVVAHHAFGAEFDRNAPIRLQGKIVRLEWVNPHSWIHLEVTRPDRGTEVWMIEGGTPNTLLRQGLRRECLAIGTELIVDGYQAKDHSLKRANGRDVTFTDGRKFFMGRPAPALRTTARSSGRGRTRRSAEARGRPRGAGLTRPHTAQQLRLAGTHPRSAVTRRRYARSRSR